MGIASVIVGILGILLSWIPCLWPIVAVHVVIGLGLGGGDVAVKLNAAKTRTLGDEQIRQARINVGVAGICLNAIALILMITWQLFWKTGGFGAFD
jgi:hypothetical protein